MIGEATKGEWQVYKEVVGSRRFTHEEAGQPLIDTNGNRSHYKTLVWTPRLIVIYQFQHRGLWIFIHKDLLNG